MDEKTMDPEALEDEFGAQLRAYGDALQSAHFDHFGELACAGGEVTADKRKRTQLALAAAAVVLLLLGVWAGTQRAERSAVVTDPTPTSEADLPETGSTQSTASTVLDGVATPPRLLSDDDRWVVSYSSARVEGSDRRTGGGTWVWRVDGKIVMLLDGVGFENLGLLEDAQVETVHNRAILPWLADGEPVALQGFDSSGPTIVEIAATLVRDDAGWSLPGGEVVVAEPLGTPGANSVYDFTLATVEAGGNAWPSIQGQTRREPIASLYRELFDASSLGHVSEIEAADHVGFLISGTDPSGSSDTALEYAVVGLDGWVISLQSSLSGDVLVGFLNSASRVTDKALWTDEQWAQDQVNRELFGVTGAPEPTAVLVQGFDRLHVESRRPRVPEVVIETWRWEEDAPTIEPPDGASEPIGFAGFSGYLSNNGQERMSEAVVADGSTSVVVSSTSWTSAELRSFTETLVLRGEDPSLGFVSNHDWYGEVFGLEEPAEASSQTRWTVSWTNADTQATAIVSAERMGWDQFVWMLMRRGWHDPGPVAWGQDERDQTQQIVMPNLPGSSRFTLFDFDPSAGVLKRVSVAGDEASVRGVYESLSQIDLDEWAALVEPFNADPLKPR